MTLRVDMTQATFQGLDPQGSYTYGQWELLRCCLLRALMTYRGVPGTEGAQVVPDLAASPPTVSADGLVWTFHLRHGIHYAPPLENVEVTAADVVRALLRSGSSRDTGFNAGVAYLPLIERFQEYASGKAESIAGVSTPDAYTLQVKETRPDASILHLFALPFSAPIPPMPGRPDAILGVATDHPLDVDYNSVPSKPGYGPFLVATGPYMFEGSTALDPSAPPQQQEPVPGFKPAWFVKGDYRGSIAMVRNPSWDPATDPNRPAIADRIEINVAPAEQSMFDEFTGGSADVLLGDNPPANVVRRFRSSPSTAGDVVEFSGSQSDYIAINLAQPPFDDPHVRRALAFVLDRRALVASRYEYGTIASHLIPDPMEGSVLSSWNAFPSTNAEGDLLAARAEMDASKYGKNGKCAAAACSDVLVLLNGQEVETLRTLRAGLSSIGIRAVFQAKDCLDPRAHAALCEFGWAVDYPDPGNFFVPDLSSRIAGAPTPTLLGSTAEELRSWHYEVRRVPSIDGDYERCAAELGVRATLCWARLDQLLVGRIVGIIPFGVAQTIRLQGARVASYSVDQAFGEPSLDRIALGA